MTEPVHIHVNNNEEKIPEKSSYSEQYIIDNNKALTCSIRTLREQIVELKQERDEFEEQVDRGETSTQYMRGLLKNLVAINKSYEKIETVYRCETRNLEQVINKFKYYFYVIILVQIISFMSLFFISEFVYIGLWFGNFAILTTIIRKNTHQTFKQQIRKEKLEIKKVKDACDFLHNYIDNL
jgi:hypothetical protein